MPSSIFRKTSNVILTSTLLVSLLSCGLQERLTTPPCTTAELGGSVSDRGKLTSQSKVTFDGIGPVKVGMSVAEAQSAGGTQLIGSPPNPGGYMVEPKDSPKVSFLVVFGTITRIDVGDKQVTTTCGAKLGDTEARIKALYPGIEVTSHKYVYDQGWHYLTFTPKDSKNSNYRIVFQTDGQRVTAIRAGKLPEVGYVEGG